MFEFRRTSALRALALLGIAIAATALGCRSVSAPCPVVTLTVTPNPSTVVQGATRQFTAVGRDYRGNVVPNTVTWSVVAGGGSIDGLGTFTAGNVNGPFANTVRATGGGLTAFATVNVVGAAGPLASIVVTPDPASVIVGGTQQFVASGRDADDNVVAIVPVWNLAAGGGALGSVSGIFTAGSVTGPFANTIRATSGGISGFATVRVVALAPPAVLGSVGAFTILAGSTVTNTGATTTITGDVGVSPGAAITGLPGGQPSPGSIHAGDATAATAQSDLTTVYNDLAGRVCGTNMTGLDLGGRTLAPGVYCFNTSAQLTGTLTLDGQGDPNAVFVIKVGSTLTTASSAAVNLIGGAQAANVYWQVGSSATLGGGTAFRGNIVALASVTMNTGATLSGRALARNGAVTMDTNAVTLP